MATDGLEMADFLAPLSGLSQGTFSLLPHIPQLRSLCLSNVCMSSFPSQVTALQGLTHLSCSPMQVLQSGMPKRASHFSSLPPSITNLSQLKCLHLDLFNRFDLDIGIVNALSALTSLHIHCRKLHILGLDNAASELSRAFKRHPSLVKVNLLGPNL